MIESLPYFKLKQIRKDTVLSKSESTVSFF